MPGLVSDLLEAGPRRRPRIVQQDVDGAELPDGGRDHGVAPGRLGDVRDHRQDLRPRRLPDVVQGALEHVLAPGAGGDPRARARKPLDGRPPQPLAAARHDRDLALESKL